MTAPQTEPTPTAADGRWTTRGVPTGSTSLTPFLVVDGAAAAIDFYTRAFGARLVSRLDGPAPDGGSTPVVMHAELDFGHGRLQLSDPQPAFGLVAPQQAEGTTSQSIVLYVPDADAVVARAGALGATVVEPPSTFVSGDRYAAVRDPWGRRWSVMTRVEDLAPEESERRVREFFSPAG